MPKQGAGLATANEGGDSHGQGGDQKGDRPGGVSVHQGGRKQGGGVVKRLGGKGVKPKPDPGNQPDECRASVCPRERANQVNHQQRHNEAADHLEVKIDHPAGEQGGDVKERAKNDGRRKPASHGEVVCVVAIRSDHPPIHISREQSRQGRADRVVSGKRGGHHAGNDQALQACGGEVTHHDREDGVLRSDALVDRQRIDIREKRTAEKAKRLRKEGCPNQNHSGKGDRLLEVPLVARAEKSHRLRVVDDGVGQAGEDQTQAGKPGGTAVDDLFCGLVVCAAQAQVFFNLRLAKRGGVRPGDDVAAGVHHLLLKLGGLGSELGLQAAPASDLFGDDEKENHRREDHDDGLKGVGDGDHLEPACHRVKRRQDRDARDHRPSRGIAPAADYFQCEKVGGADHPEDDRAIKHLHEHTGDTGGKPEPRLEILGVGVHAGAVHRQDDAMREQQPTADAADPVDQVKLHAAAVSCAGVDYQVGGVDQRGVERQADDPPRQSAPSQKPILAVPRAAALE